MGYKNSTEAITKYKYWQTIIKIWLIINKLFSFLAFFMFMDMLNYNRMY